MKQFGFIERCRADAAANLPATHAFVVDGEIRDDDLLWSMFEQKWLRADDPAWLYRTDRAEDSVGVARRIAADTTGFESQRRYTISR